MIKHSLTAILAAAIVASTASAQTKTSLQFVSFPKSNDNEPVQLLAANGEAIEVELPTNRISESYLVPTSREWILGKSYIDDEGNPNFKVHGKASSINEKKQLILVIRKGESNDDGFVLIPMSNSKQTRGGGTFSFFNASGYEIAGILSDKKFQLKPGKFTTVQPSPSKTKGVYQYCDTQLLYRHEERIRPFFTSTWRLNEAVRSFIFFYQDVNSGHLKMHSIRNFVK